MSSLSLPKHTKSEGKKEKKSQTQIHLDMTLTEGRRRQRRAELSGITNEFIYDWQ